jgi:hypothetical protein
MLWLHPWKDVKPSWYLHCAWYLGVYLSWNRLSSNKISKTLSSPILKTYSKYCSSWMACFVGWLLHFCWSNRPPIALWDCLLLSEQVKYHVSHQSHHSHLSFGLGHSGWWRQVCIMIVWGTLLWFFPFCITLLCHQLLHLISLISGHESPYLWLILLISDSCLFNSDSLNYC